MSSLCSIEDQRKTSEWNQNGKWNSQKKNELHVKCVWVQLVVFLLLQNWMPLFCGTIVVDAAQLPKIKLETINNGHCSIHKLANFLRNGCKALCKSDHRTRWKTAWYWNPAPGWCDMTDMTGQNRTTCIDFEISWKSLWVRKIVLFFCRSTSIN